MLIINNSILIITIRIITYPIYSKKYIRNRKKKLFISPFSPFHIFLHIFTDSAFETFAKK